MAILEVKNISKSFDSLKVYSQPMTGIDRQARKLKEEVLTDIKTQNNEISGKISLSIRTIH